MKTANSLAITKEGIEEWPKDKNKNVKIRRSRRKRITNINTSITENNGQHTLQSFNLRHKKNLILFIIRYILVSYFIIFYFF